MASTVLIVVSPYYKEISELMVKGAQDALISKSVNYEVVEAFGALEIPVTIKMAHESNRFDGFIAIGCVIRGETTHYDIVCNESAAGLSRLALDHGIAIGNAILTCETEEQAIERARPDKLNKGRDAAMAVLGVMEARKRFLG